MAKFRYYIFEHVLNMSFAIFEKNMNCEIRFRNFRAKTKERTEKVSRISKKKIRQKTQILQTQSLKMTYFHFRWRFPDFGTAGEHFAKGPKRTSYSSKAQTFGPEIRNLVAADLLC